MHTYIDSQEACNALHITSGPLLLCSGVLKQLFSGTGVRRIAQGRGSDFDKDCSRFGQSYGS